MRGDSAAGGVPRRGFYERAPTVPAAEAAFADFASEWGAKYPAIIRSWENTGTEFVPFREFPTEHRKVVCTTNAIESLNARFRRAVRHRAHFPNEQAAMKVLYLVATAKKKNRENMTGEINGWKHILNTPTIHYGDRINDHIQQSTTMAVYTRRLTDPNLQ